MIGATHGMSRPRGSGHVEGHVKARQMHTGASRRLADGYSPCAFVATHFLLISTSFLRLVISALMGPSSNKVVTVLGVSLVALYQWTVTRFIHW